MKRKLLIFMSILILGTALTGCSNDDNDKVEVANEVVEEKKEEKEEIEEEKEEIEEEKEEEKIEDLEANAKYYSKYDGYDWVEIPKEKYKDTSPGLYVAYYFKEDGTPLVNTFGYIIRGTDTSLSSCGSNPKFSSGYTLEKNELLFKESHVVDNDVYRYAYRIHNLTEKEVNEIYDLLKTTETYYNSVKIDNSYADVAAYYSEDLTRLREYCDSLYKEKLANNEVEQIYNEGTPLPIE